MLYVRVDDAPKESLATVLRHVAPLVPEVPYEMALDMLRQAYIEFARKTHLLVAYQSIAMQKGVRTYPLLAPEGYEIFAVSDLDSNGTLFRRHRDADHWYSGWGSRFYIRGNREIEYADAPSRDGYARNIAFHLLPTQYVQDIPTEISVPYGKGMAMGALADMLEMPNQPWYNPNLAQIKRREFSRSMLSARDLAETNRGSKTLMMKPIRVV